MTQYTTHLEIKYPPGDRFDIQALVDATEDQWYNQLGPREAITVPKGVQHRPRAPKRTVLIMVEGAGVVPTGD
jgi:hypothetical protein